MGQPGQQPAGGQHHGRAPGGHQQVAAGPAGPGRGRGQHLLGPELGLLGTQPQGRLDGVAGGQHADPGQDRGQVDVGDAARPAQAGQQLGRLRVLGGELHHVLGDHPEGQAGHGRPDRPAGQGAALQPPGQGERAAQPGRGVGRPQPGGQHPGAQVAPDEQGRGRHQQGPEQGHRQEQDLPAVAGERPEPLGPADRRQPRQPGQLGGGVADGPEQERRPQHGEGEPVGRPGVLGQLDTDGGDPGEDQPVEGAVGGQGDRPGGREAEGDEAEGGDRGQRQVDRQHVQQAGGQPGVAADRGRADQLGPAGLLLLAGVAGHQQDAHQADQERPGGDQLPGGGAAVGAGVIGRPLEGDHRRVGPDALGRPGQPVQVGLGRVQREHAGRLADGEQGQAEDPDGPHDPVAAQGEPEQLAGAGEPAHRDALARASSAW